MPQPSIQNSSLYNEDLAPVPKSKRTWGTWNYAALWISMSLCIPTYMLASSLIGGGMNWWQAILTIFFGKCHCAYSHDSERPRRRKIRHPLPGFCKGKLWNRRCKHSRNAPCHCSLRMVWHSGLDWRICPLPNDGIMDTLSCTPSANFPGFIRAANWSSYIFLFVLAS